MALYAPIVSNASDGTLDYYEIQSGVQLEVPMNMDTERGDMYIIHWGDVYQVEHIIDTLDELPLVFDVVNEFPPACLYDGTYVVFYERIDEAHNVAVSPEISFTVKTSFS